MLPRPKSGLTQGRASHWQAKLTALRYLAESEEFESSSPVGLTVFETAALDHSANSPKNFAWCAFTPKGSAVLTSYGVTFFYPGGSYGSSCSTRFDSLREHFLMVIDALQPSYIDSRYALRPTPWMMAASKPTFQAKENMVGKRGFEPRTFCPPGRRAEPGCATSRY